jgi:ABC-2 type transport system permease protein
VGLGQEVWSGNFDFTLLRPINTQFFVTFRIWRLNALLDLFLGMMVIAFAVFRSTSPVLLWNWLLFGITLFASVLTLYALLLAFSSLVFWSPGFLFTWVFDALFQLARYPVGIYPPALRFLLTWIIPVGLITTIPAMALSGKTQWLTVTLAILVSILLFGAASWLFQKGIRRYHSASS